MSEAEQSDLLKKAAAMLGEHFDAVQIVASFPTGKNNDYTGYVAHGTGNFFARVGLCQQFVDRYKQREQADFIAERLKEGPDEGEDWKEKA